MLWSGTGAKPRAAGYGRNVGSGHDVGSVTGRHDVVLQLWTTADGRVEGTVDQGGSRSCFSGLLELLAVLETILTAGR